ncbi:MAG: hypothetical protein IID15_07550 [Candidatus Marinimicrobia bacterium]|nr:hypothetical protein [Candidatus Neomarinimicrobiota bacterium]
MLEKTKRLFAGNWKAMALVGSIALSVYLGAMFEVNAKVLALWAVTVGLVTNGFVALATLVSLVPVLGPLLVKLLSLPFFYMLNGIGYLVSLLAIKKGYGVEVISHKLLTIILMIGVVIGYILGNLLPI